MAMRDTSRRCSTSCLNTLRLASGVLFGPRLDQPARVSVGSAVAQEGEWTVLKAHVVEIAVVADYPGLLAIIRRPKAIFASSLSR